MLLEHDERAAFHGGPSRHLFLSGRRLSMLRLRDPPYDDPGLMAHSTYVMGGGSPPGARPSKSRIGTPSSDIIRHARQQQQAYFALFALGMLVFRRQWRRN